MTEIKSNKNYSSAQQLTLPVRQLIHNTFDSYYETSNSQVGSLLKTSIIERSDQFVFLVGPNQSGKTHLLEAGLNELELVCPERHGIFVCLSELTQAEDIASNYEDLFDNLCSFDVVALDNIEDWFDYSRLNVGCNETLLFNLFNKAKDQDVQLIISSSKAVDELNCSLPDLISRLKSGLTLRLKPYTENEKIKIIKELAFNKGLSFNDDTASYIIKRANRDLSSLIEVLMILDRESLTSQRKLTIPFIKKTLNW